MCSYVKMNPIKRQDKICVIQMKNKIIIFSIIMAVSVVCALFILMTPAATPDTQGPAYRVTRVIDGDTIEIDYHGEKERVRMIGIDTPESVHPDKSKNTEFGKTASEFTKEKLLNKDISLEFDVSERDRYGRLLAYVWLDGVMFNEYLVQQGYAQTATYPPDVKYVSLFAAAQEKARYDNKGFWGIWDEDVDKTDNEYDEKKAVLVWIPVSGSRYHVNENCGNMKNPSQVSVEEAQTLGYIECSKCK